MKLLAPVMALILAFALLVQGRTSRAFACTCIVDARERHVTRMLESSDAVVVGHVSERRPGDPETVVFETERQYDGDSQRQFIVRYSYDERSMCPGYTVTEGTRHLLWLQHREPQPLRSDWEVRQYGPPDPGDPPGVFTPMGCLQSQFASTQHAQETIATLEQITTPWPGDPGSVWLPYAFTAGVLSVLAIVVLAIARARRP